MNRKRIRQMNTALLRRLTGRPTAEYFSGQPLLERLESENYIQRFAPLYDGTRLRCGDVLELSCQLTARRGPVGFGTAEARVDGKLACKAELTFALTDKPE